jgi:hypothetical protein
MLARMKTPHKFENHCKVLIGLHRYLDRINHEFLAKQKQNSKYELEILFSIMKCDAGISRYKYKESLFMFWKVKHLLKAWENMHMNTIVPIVPRINTQRASLMHTQSYSSTTPMSRDLESDSESEYPSSEQMSQHDPNIKYSPKQADLTRRVEFKPVLNEEHFAPRQQPELKRVEKAVRIETPQDQQTQQSNSQQPAQRSIFRSLFGALSGPQTSPPNQKSRGPTLSSKLQSSPSPSQLSPLQRASLRDEPVSPGVDDLEGIYPSSPESIPDRKSSYIAIKSPRDHIPAKRLGKSYSEASLLSKLSEATHAKAHPPTQQLSVSIRFYIIQQILTMCYSL